jgi:hypothetical protein
MELDFVKNKKLKKELVNRLSAISNTKLLSIFNKYKHDV